jgi:hypothetical protein
MGPDRVYDDDADYSLKPLREVEEHERRQRGRRRRFLPEDPKELQETDVIELGPGARVRELSAGARTRSRHPRKLAEESYRRELHLPRLLWEELEHYSSDAWDTDLAPFLNVQGEQVEGDLSAINALLAELLFIAEMRCGNENYAPGENADVVRAVSRVFEDAGVATPSWFEDCMASEEDDVPGENVGWFDIDTMDFAWR